MSSSVPHDEAAEAAFLASCIVNMSNSYDELDEGAASGITEASFHSFHNKLIWHSLCVLRRDSLAVDENALLSYFQNTSVSTTQLEADRSMRDKKISNVVTVAQLMDITEQHSSYPIKGFIQSLKDKELLRKAIKVGDDLIKMSLSGTVNGEEARAKAESALLDLTSQQGTRTTHVAAPDAYAERADALINGEEMQELFKTGFPSIDAFLGGFPRKTNIIIGARPSTGKTTIGFQIAANMCVSHGLKGVLFSLESPASQLIDRAVALRSKVPLQRMRDRILSEREKKAIHESKKDIENLGLLIDEGRGRTVFDIRSLARRYKRTHGLDFVVIDHFSKIRPVIGRGRENRQGVEEISAELDDMKHELDCAVITLAQFSRSSERENRKPRMSDLRECGTLEQDADIIMLLSRHEENGESDNTRRDLSCPKNRDGTAGWDITLGFEGPIYRFTDTDAAAQTQRPRVYEKPEQREFSRGGRNPDKVLDAAVKAATINF